MEDWICGFFWSALKREEKLFSTPVQVNSNVRLLKKMLERMSASKKGEARARGFLDRIRALRSRAVEVLVLGSLSGLVVSLRRESVSWDMRSGGREWKYSA